MVISACALFLDEKTDLALLAAFETHDRVERRDGVEAPLSVCLYKLGKILPNPKETRIFL